MCVRMRTRPIISAPANTGSNIKKKERSKGYKKKNKQYTITTATTAEKQNTRLR